MKFVFGIVVCFLSCGVSLASEETYRAGIISASSDGDIQKYVPLIHEAAKLNADIVVLPSPKIFSSLSSVEELFGAEDYDEFVTTLSEASKQAGLYVVAHLLEKTICQSKYELVRSNLVFGRDGNVVSVYRKPLNTLANCTTGPSEMVTFNTDFGVHFGLLMEEDLILEKAEDLKGLKNFVVTGAWSSGIPFLSVSQFASSWAFTNKVNVVGNSGVFLGRNGGDTGAEAGLKVVDVKKAGEETGPIIPPIVTSSKLDLKVLPGEDLSDFIVRPLNVAASAKGFKETVCHDGFCCEFYVKTNSIGVKEEGANYGLSAFNGIRTFGKHNMGVQTCAIFVCAGLYKRTCAFGSNSNSTNVIFEKISIHTNSSSGNSHYPIILAADSNQETNGFHFDTKLIGDQKQVTLQLSNVKNLLSFGILGRDFTKDTETAFVFEEELSFKDEMHEFFDYLWIRLRVLIFVVSIYFLEMM